jgi:hypothetical protein
MTARAMRMVERNMSGSPMKFATAIIVASFRVSSATPCEMPAKPAATSIATARMTTQPAKPLATRAPIAYPTTSRISPWIAACTAARISCENTSELRRAGVARKRSITPRSMSVTIDMPAHVPAKNAFMTTTPGRKKSA